MSGKRNDIRSNGPAANSRSSSGSSASYNSRTLPSSAPSSGYSVFVHVPGTQLVVELLAAQSERLSLSRDQSTNESINNTPVEGWRSSTHPLGSLMPLEPRLTYAAWHEHVLFGSKPAHTSSSSKEHVGPQYGLVATSVSRAISTRALLNATEEFYMEGAKCSCTMAINAWQAVGRVNSPATIAKRAPLLRVLLWKRCFRWPGSFSDICFTTYEAGVEEEGETDRGEKIKIKSDTSLSKASLSAVSSSTPLPSSSLAASLLTSGNFTPLVFETMLATSHEKWLRGKPACGMDR